MQYNCNNDTIPETTTTGKTKIVVDESYSLLFDTQISTFQSLYKYSNIDITCKPEGEALKDLINDSCKVIVINRDLTPEEKETFKASNIYPKSIKIAEDAVVFVVNNENPDTVFTVEKITRIIGGTDTLWDTKKANSGIRVVFDNPNSANARYMKQELLKGQELGRNCFAVKSNKEVVEYVNKNKNALGVISVNWISDRNDSVTRAFLKQVKVAGIASKEGEKPYQPYQAWIKTKDYPFCRDVYMINRQTNAGLGTGFVSFVAGQIGQRIILRAGLIPATMPVREVRINTKFNE